MTPVPRLPPTVSASRYSWRMTAAAAASTFSPLTRRLDSGLAQSPLGLGRGEALVDPVNGETRPPAQGLDEAIDLPGLGAFPSVQRKGHPHHQPVGVTLGGVGNDGVDVAVAPGTPYGAHWDCEEVGRVADSEADAPGLPRPGTGWSNVLSRRPQDRPWRTRPGTFPRASSSLSALLPPGLGHLGPPRLRLRPSPWPCPWRWPPASSPLATRSGVTIATSEGRPFSNAARTTTALDSFLLQPVAHLTHALGVGRGGPGRTLPSPRPRPPPRRGGPGPPAAGSRAPAWPTAFASGRRPR